MRKLIFAVIYGLIFINYIDISVSFGLRTGYHLWLILMYFIPFVLLGLKECIAYGLIASLCNDLFFYPLSNILAGMNYDLLETYMFQLGFQMFKVKWYADLLFVRIPVTSILMGTTIYVRLAVVSLLLMNAYKKRKKSKASSLKAQETS